MINDLKMIEASLEKTKTALDSIKNFVGELNEQFSIIDESFSNDFFYQRTTIDQLKSNITISSYHNDRLRYVVKKIISEPELIDQEAFLKLIDELSMVDASLKDGKFGRPVDGVIFDEVSVKVDQILTEFIAPEKIKTWNDWLNWINLYLKCLEDIIVLFPIQYQISPQLLTIYHGMKAIKKKITDQIKIQSMINSLTRKIPEAELNEHNSYFRLHISRLQRKKITAPCVDIIQYEADNNSSESDDVEQPDSGIDDKVKSRIFKHLEFLKSKKLKQFLVSKLDMGGYDSKNSLNLSIYTEEEE